MPRQAYTQTRRASEWESRSGPNDLSALPLSSAWLFVRKVCAAGGFDIAASAVKGTCEDAAAMARCFARANVQFGGCCLSRTSIRLKACQNGTVTCPGYKNLRM